MALVKLAGESSMTEANLRAKVVAVEKSLSAERMRVECFLRKIVGEAEKR